MQLRRILAVEARLLSMAGSSREVDAAPGLTGRSHGGMAPARARLAGQPTSACDVRLRAAQEQSGLPSEGGGGAPHAGAKLGRAGLRVQGAPDDNT